MINICGVANLYYRVAPQIGSRTDVDVVHLWHVIYDQSEQQWRCASPLYLLGRP